MKAPEGAPNRVIVPIDDMGFGQPSTLVGGFAMVMELTGLPFPRVVNGTK